MANIGHDLLDVPFPEMIRQLGLSIAEAQFALDEVGIRLAQVMAGQEVEVPDPDDPNDPNKSVTLSKTRVRFGNQELSMLELGFTPTFYQFVDTIIEVKVSLTMSSVREEKESERRLSIRGGYAGIPGFGGGARMNATTVSASYASKYQYSAEGSSLLRTKLVPVPTPAVLEERIRNLIDEE